MNYLLSQITEICEDAPEPLTPGDLHDFAGRLEDYDERLTSIFKLARELQKILDGEPHAHAAGTMVDLHIDTCAKCGRDIRDPVHTSAA